MKFANSKDKFNAILLYTSRLLCCPNLRTYFCIIMPEKLTIRERYAHLFNDNDLAQIISDPQESVIPAFRSGGHVKGQGNNPDDGTKGGEFIGRKHSEGGIKAINLSTNTPIEVEGGEVIITAPAVSDTKKRMFNGKMMTNKEILSEINQSGGGVKFEDGGDIPHIACNGTKFDLGGQMMEDYLIIQEMENDMNQEGISPLFRGLNQYISNKKK